METTAKPSDTFSHSSLPSAQGAAGPYPCASTSGKHVEGNLRGFRYVVEDRTVKRGERVAKSAATSRRRDI